MCYKKFRQPTKNKIRVLGVIIIYLFIDKGYAQDIQKLAENKKPLIEAYRIHEKIVIDGSLNEPGW